MLVAHLVPGYFAAVHSQIYWKPEWSKNRRIALWAIALGSTAAPDLDVIYNATFRGFCGHTILLTHSLFPYLILALVWFLIRRHERLLYLQITIGLVTIGGLSHLVLDVLAHGTTLLYPFSSHLFGSSYFRLLDRGVWPYVLDPVFLLEPFLVALITAHWISIRLQTEPRLKKIALFGLFSGWAGFSIVYLVSLPTLRTM